MAITKRAFNRTNKTNVAICTNCDGSGIKARRTVNCTACNATGRYVVSKKRPCHCGGKEENCRRCFGTGQKTVFTRVVECRACAGKGYRHETDYCPTCGHEGSARFHAKVKATVGSVGELWPS